jgi:hypothetical protein
VVRVIQTLDFLKLTGNALIDQYGMRNPFPAEGSGKFCTTTELGMGAKKRILFNIANLESIVQLQTPLSIKTYQIYIKIQI